MYVEQGTPHEGEDRREGRGRGGGAASSGRRTGLQHTCGQGDPNSCQQHEPSNHRRSSCQATFNGGETEEIGGKSRRGKERNARQGGMVGKVCGKVTALVGSWVLQYKISVVVSEYQLNG